MTQTAHSRYDQLAISRSPYLDRARDCAKLTIPSLLPPSGFGPTSKLYTPYQGIGARGVNNLANKSIIAMLPPNTPMFRQTLDEAVLEKMSDGQPIKTQMEAALATIERRVTVDIEARKPRAALTQAMRHVVVAGNALVFIGKKSVRYYPLDRYVVKRDPSGNLLEIITKEEVAFSALPKEMREVLKPLLEKDADRGEKGKRKPLTLYTHVWLDDSGMWKVRQEVKGITVPRSDGSYPADALPWMALRFSHIDGEDYGRGYVEEYLGDLTSLEALSKAIVEGSAAAAKVLLLVNPNGTTDIREIAQSESGDIRSGNAQDVTVLQLDKYADFRVAAEMIDRIERRLSMAFLLNSSVQRAGERVTAEEIRYVARELEDALGGVYSILSTDLQLPLVTVVMRQMELEGRLPKLPKSMVRPTIITGLAALGRGHDLERLVAFVQQLAPLGPEVIQKYLKVGDYISRVAASVGLDPNGLVRSEEEVAQLDQAAQMQAMVSKLGGPAINAISQQMQPQG